MTGEQGRAAPGAAPAVGPLPRRVRPLWLRVVDAIVFGAAVLLVVVVASSTLQQPLHSGRVLAYILLAPAAMITWHRSLAFLRRRIASTPPGRIATAGRLVGVSKWLGAPIGAVLACVGLEAAVLQRALGLVERELEPVVSALEAKLHANQPAPGEIGEVLAAAGKGEQVRGVVYVPKDRAFVLAARSGSIDMDGETIYYDSRDRDWHRFHNDLAETNDPDAIRFKAGTRDVPSIRYSCADGTWRRQEPQ